jgi:hypothetical protein
METNASDELFSDDEGLQPISPEDIPPDRQVFTTPYDAPVKTLVDDISEKNLVVNPKFQRRDVWNQIQKSKLIESLLLNIPIPVLYFAEDDDGTRVVVDGQQRLRAIYDFVTGKFKLKGLQVLGELNGKGWEDLTPRQSRIIDNRTLRCVVISASSDRNLRFEMFERLNTGGVELNEQELRNCLFQGKLNELINSVAEQKEWLHLLRVSKPDKRLRHHELILRYIAISNELNSYRPPFKVFLNNFMKDNRNPEDVKLEQFRSEFFQSVKNVGIVFEINAFRRYQKNKKDIYEWEKTLNRAVFDVQMLGLSDVEDAVLQNQKKMIVKAFQDLCGNSTFIDAVTQATSDRSRLYTRLSMWGMALLEIDVVSPMIKRLSELKVSENI